MPKLIGQPSYYRPKHPRPISIVLTADAHALVATTVERTGASRSDVIEQLVRRFSRHVNFKQLSMVQDV